MEQSPLIAQGLPIALFIIMIGMGLTLTPADFARELRSPRGMIIGSVLQLLVMPLAGLLLAGLPGMTAGLAVGLVIMAACPGGTTSNLIAYLGRGNVALSIVLTVVASLITIVTLPLWVNLALRLFDGSSDAPITLPFMRTVVMLSVITVIPVAIGMAVRGYNADWARRAERLVGLFGACVLVALVIGLAVANYDNLIGLLLHTGPACALLNVVGFGFGFGMGRVLGLNWPDCITLSAELGIKNGTVGLLVALSLLDNSEMAVPAALYSLMMYGFGAVLIAYGRRKIAVATPST
jgi:bile acid:Na+ symporter, BASS family